MCLEHDIIVAHNYVNHPGFQHVSVIPSEMKDEIINNINYLRPDEKNRLIAELTKENDPDDLDKFIKFTYILDNKRGVKITNILHEWKKYFNYE
jgi:hypothetical protein